MTDDNVLFLRGNENDTNADNEDVWDDSALIKAYDRAVNLAKEEVAKRMGVDIQNSKVKEKQQNSKQHHHNKECKKWTVGAPCCATYSEDGKVYEAVITNISEDMGVCSVKFIGYDNTEIVQINSLMKSGGLKSQIAQQKEALGEKVEEENIGNNETIFSLNTNSKKYNGEKMDCESEEAKTYKHDFLAGTSFNSIGDLMPPAPPLPPQLMAKLPEDDADALSSMLMSWYISGFHTGYYHGLKQARCNREKGKNC